ncbi:hypothetical protein F8388_024489 [Cannabis sativa]|uniref:Uncharacterized protein n=1 Tax=Cannabis sativa TaxID=3483 RepID=A0A7J6E022_CANSA|nr:hypothetical protein F8388_024489 [Cannabis sativa]
MLMLVLNVMEEEVTGIRRRATSAPPDAPRPKEKKNKGANSAMEHVMEQLAKSIAAKTEASLVRSESMRKYIDSREKRINEETSNITGSINMEDCQNILDGIPDLDDKRYLKALREFVANPEWRGIFLRMSEQRRRAYLDSLLDLCVPKMDDSDEEFQILFGDTSSSSSEEVVGQVLLVNQLHEMHQSQQIRRPLRPSNMSGRTQNQQGGDEPEIYQTPEINFSQAYMAQMENVRDDIAGQMWLAYNNNNRA